MSPSLRTPNPSVKSITMQSAEHGTVVPGEALTRQVET